MRQSTSITGCVRRSVGRSVGWSVCDAFVRRSTRRTYWPTWPCLLLFYCSQDLIIFFDPFLYGPEATFSHSPLLLVNSMHLSVLWPIICNLTIVDNAGCLMLQHLHSITSRVTLLWLKTKFDCYKCISFNSKKRNTKSWHEETKISCPFKANHWK